MLTLRWKRVSLYVPQGPKLGSLSFLFDIFIVSNYKLQRAVWFLLTGRGDTPPVLRVVAFTVIKGQKSSAR